MSTPEQRAKWRAISYTKGVDPNRKAGNTIANTNKQLERRQKFLAQYPDPRETLDEWQELNIIQGGFERVAFERFNGLDGSDPEPLESIAKDFQVSRQCIAKWLKKIDTRLEKYNAGQPIPTNHGRPRKRK